MSFRPFIAVSIALLSVLTGAVASSADARLAAAAVESTAMAEVIRIVSTRPLDNLQYKIICSEDSIRIRFDNLAARGPKIEYLKMPADGPLYQGRIVPRGTRGSVVQLYPRSNPISTCGRTTVAAMGGEMVISTALSESDRSRWERIQKDGDKGRANTVRAESLLSKKVDDNSRVQDVKEKEGSGDELDSKGRPLFEKRAKQATESQNSQTNKTTSPVGEKLAADGLEAGALRFMAGFLFAGIMAGIAFYLQKRKKALPGKEDNIDIISSKRIGAKQSLVLASVQGTKFLLAVGDKSISTLGMVPTESKTRRAPQISEESPSFELESPETQLTEWLKTQKKKIVQQNLPVAEKPKPNDKVRPRKSDSAPVVERFRGEFENAMEAVQNSEDMGNLGRDGLSNAAGLIAMARMRSEMKRRAKDKDLEA